MALTITGKYALTLTGSGVNPIDLEAASTALTLAKSKTFTNGTGNNQINLMWSDQRTLSASATEDLDLAGVLTSVFGATLTFAKIKAIVIHAAAANANNVRVTRPAANGVPLFLAASDGIDILPDGLFVVTAPLAGITVTAATGDLITVTNSGAGTSVTYDIAILGVAA